MFEKDITRSIEGVIKADDEKSIELEVDEYVLTNEVEAELSNLLEDYLNPQTANGVWISGFFGSGKSHLLKMLSHLLGSSNDSGIQKNDVIDKFQEKTDDAMLKGMLDRLKNVDAQSILFNIDQKTDQGSKNSENGMIKTFLREIYEPKGY
jgi:predicted AAA+ superfamily ATPase